MKLKKSEKSLPQFSGQTIKKLFLLLSLFSIFSSVFAQYNFQINATVSNDLDGAAVLLETTSYNIDSPRTTTYSNYIKKNVFHFNGLLSNPCAGAMIKITKGGKVYYRYFVLDSGTHTFNLKPIKTFLSMKGIDNTNNYLWNTSVSIRAEKGPTRIGLLKCLDLAKSHPNDFYSLVLLSTISNQSFFLSPDEILSVQKQLNPIIQASSLSQSLTQKMIRTSAIQKGKILPPFNLISTANTSISSDTLKSRFFIIGFGATWCLPCKENIPVIKKIHETYKSTGLSVSYINLDSNFTKWKGIINKYQIEHWINMTDTVSMNHSAITKQFAITAIPFYLVVDRQMKIVYNSYEEHDLNLSVLQARLHELNQKNWIELW